MIVDYLQKIFKREQEAYQEEGLDENLITYKDNADILVSHTFTLTV